MTQQKEHHSSKKIRKNFLVVSNYNNNIQWVPEYTDHYIVYDRSDSSIYTNNIDPHKIKKSPNIGYNLYDYFTFIIDHYDELPDVTIFAKGNIFPRHVTQTYFDRIMNNEYFTPIEDHRMHKEKWPAGLFSADGGFCQLNGDQYLHNHPLRYFATYNDFLTFCYKDPLIPRYLRFAPGGNYIVPRENILKLPKIFYENLRLFISYCPLPGEAHIIERALYTLWMSNFELNDIMLTPVDASTMTIRTESLSQRIKKGIVALIRAVRR